MTPNINKLLAARRRDTSRGAPMGAPDEAPDDLDKLYVQRLRMVDGGYAADGTYWGAGDAAGAMWAAFKPDLSALVYVRADSRDGAIKAVRASYAGLELSFFNEGVSE